MAISNFTLNRIYLDYKARLEGTKISKIVKISDYDFSFFLYSNKQESLIISLEPLHPYILISSSYFKVIQEGSPFIASIKKYFENGTILKVEKMPNDRVIVFTVKKLTPTYQTITSKLIVYLIPHMTNAIITDENGIIIDCLKKSSSLEDKHPIIKGVKFFFEESENKDITLDDTLDTLKSKIGTNIYKDIEKRVLDGEKLSSILNEIITSKSYYSCKNDILSIPLKYQKCEEISLDALSSIYEKKEQEKFKKDHFDLVYKTVDHKLKGLKKKLINLDKDVKKNQVRSDYVEIGNLLFMSQDLYVKGSEAININGQEIALDPTLDLIANAKKYFKLYQKSKTALIELEKQKTITKEKVEFFEQIASQLPFASLEDMEDIIEELKNEGYIKVNNNSKNHQKNKKNTQRIYNPHFIFTKNNEKIGFGLSSYQNEYLTFTLARKDYYFLHAKDVPGPHVVIFSNNPSKEAILLASEIALYYASLKAGEVYLLDVKDVKKIPGKRGKVSFSSYDIININNIRSTSEELFKRQK
jgi:predicted ribosome quality control (RQC) complex YloA/Tae2 family protein